MSVSLSLPVCMCCARDGKEIFLVTKDKVQF